MKLGKEEENKLLIFSWFSRFWCNVTSENWKQYREERWKRSKTELRNMTSKIKTKEDITGAWNIWKKKLIENKDQKIIIVLYIKTRGAVTRIRTWVIAATTQCTNHFTITATTAAHKCFQVKNYYQITRMTSTCAINIHSISYYFETKNQHSSRAPR